MTTKLLSIKKDNNIIIYCLKYEEKDLMDYLKFLSKLYSYNEQNVIESILMNDKLLSMGKFDYMKKYCEVSEQFRIINTLEDIDSNTKRVKAEINVRYFSMVSEILKEVFLTEDILINTTELIRLFNHILNRENNFTFNKVLDLYEKRKEWNDPSRGILDFDQYEKYVAYRMRSINVDKMRLTEKQNAKILKNIDEIIKQLSSMFEIEQIGMFPIQEKLPVIEEILKIYGERNQEFEYFYGTLEDTDINIDGAKIINEMADKICGLYSIDRQEETIKNKINHRPKKIPFLQF